MGCGGKGRGPGEFERIGSIEPFAQDSLLVLDVSLLRVSVLTRDGRYVRSANLAQQDAFAVGVKAALPLTDGTMFLVSGGSTGLLPHPVVPGYAREVDPAEHVDAGGRLLGRLGPFPGGEWYITANTMGAAPFAHFTSYAVRDSTLIVGTGDNASVGVYSSQGQMLESIRWPAGDLAVTSGDVDAYKKAALALARDAEQRRITEALLAEMPMPKRMPAYFKVLADERGTLWIGAYPLPGSVGGQWFVFSSAGHFLGAVPFPDRFRVLDITSSSVLGVWSDDQDVEHVRVYAIKR